MATEFNSDPYQAVMEGVDAKAWLQSSAKDETQPLQQDSPISYELLGTDGAEETKDEVESCGGV